MKRIVKIGIFVAIAMLIMGGCMGTQNMLYPSYQNKPLTKQQREAIAKKYKKQYGNFQNKMIMQKPTLEYYINNPILNVEMDTILAEELATMIKMNKLILDRIPISIDDKWPELLRDYQKGLSDKDKNSTKISKAKDAYNEYLDNLLKKDYSFYQIYDPVALNKQIKSVAGIAIVTSPSAMKKIILLKIIENYGKNMEHLKNTISYKPLGCSKKYYNPKFSNMFKPLKKHICRRIERRLAKRCEFFSKPIEDILFKYEKGFYDLKVGARCFKVVRGKSYPSFKRAFYNLLPNNKRDSIKRADEELENINMALAKLKGEIEVAKKSDKKDENRIALLEKKEKILKEKKDNIEEKRSKLFEDAKSHIVVNKEKIELALKLKTIIDYINHNLTSVGIGTTILTVNTIFDVKDIAKLGINAQNALMMTAAIYMQNSKNKNYKEGLKLAKKRLKLLLKRAIKLPENAITIVYGISSQKSFISDYEDYIDALIEAGKKAKYIKG